MPRDIHQTVTQDTVKAVRRIRIVENVSADQPPKRRFVEYRLVHEGEGGSLAIVDVYEEFNLVTDEYEQKREPTLIGMPAGVGQEFVAACTEVRRELDRYGLRIFFDPPEAGGQIRPKWRYRLYGRMRTDFAQVCAEPVRCRDPYESDPDIVPPEIVELVTAIGREYYRSREWKEWFGRKLQRKREQVVVRGAIERLSGVGAGA